MAEYYPLLDRAVSGLPDQTPEARRSIYDRARAALLGQLRNMQPPIGEDNVARESQALDEAIARVESRFAPSTAVADRSEPTFAAPGPAGRAAAPRAGAEADASGTMGAERPRPPPAGGQPPRQSSAAPGNDLRAPGLPTGKAPAISPPSARERPNPAGRPVTPVDAQARPDPAPAPRSSAIRPVMALRPVTPAKTTVAKTSPAPLPRDSLGASSAGQNPERPAVLLPPAANLAAEGGSSSATARVGAREGEDFGSALDAVARKRDDDLSDATRARDAAVRPQAPRPVPPRRFRLPAVLGAILIGIVMIGIGIAAWRLRDRPEQMIASHGDPQAGSQAAPGKIVERANVPDGATHEDANDESSAVPAPIGSASAPDAQPADTGSGIAVAQRAALLVDAPDDPQKVRTFAGTVIWHLDSVSPGQGQPLATAIKADIDIPDAKLKITMLMQKNPEPQLPASHTIEFHFLPQAGNTLGNVKQVNVPEMRKDDDAPTGEPLTGVPVAITENYFLVGLSRGAAAESQNLRLITERNWFDMSILFAPNKLAKVTFEKGGAGQHIIEDALKSWH